MQMAKNMFCLWVESLKNIKKPKPTRIQEG